MVITAGGWPDQPSELLVWAGLEVLWLNELMALTTGGPSSSCEMIILSNNSHGGIVWLCLWFSSICYSEISQFFTICEICPPDRLKAEKIGVTAQAAQDEWRAKTKHFLEKTLRWRSNCEKLRDFTVANWRKSKAKPNSIVDERCLKQTMVRTWLIAFFMALNDLEEQKQNIF